MHHAHTTKKKSRPTTYSGRTTVDPFCLGLYGVRERPRQMTSQLTSDLFSLHPTPKSKTTTPKQQQQHHFDSGYRYQQNLHFVFATNTTNAAYKYRHEDDDDDDVVTDPFK